MPRKRQTSSDVVHLISSSPRPTRNRNAPQRLNLSSFDAYHQRSSSSGGTKSNQRQLPRKQHNIRAERHRDPHQEEEYILNYSYAHIGQALSEEHLDCWVDVPLLEAKNRHVLPAVVEAPSSEVEEEESLETESHLSKVKKGKPALSNDISQVGDEVDLTKDASPTQDHPANLAASLPFPIEADHIEKSTERNLLGAKKPASYSIEKDIPRKETTIVEDTSSPAPSFVDALMDEQEVEAHIALVASRSPMHIDHPETRLSHSRDEGYTIPSAQFQPRRLNGIRKGNNEINGQSLFFGSDDDNDDETSRINDASNKRRAANGGQSKEAAKSTLEQADRPVSSKGKGKELESSPAQRGSLVIEGGSIDQPDKRKESTSGKASRKHNLETSNHSVVEGRKKARKIESSGMAKARESKKEDHKRRSKVEKEDLVQNLNVDAFANSTSGRRDKAKRLKSLKKLQKAKVRAERKRQGEEISSSESSSSSDSDSSSIDSDSDSDPTDFIVDDEDDETATMSTHQQKKIKKNLLSRQSPPPPSLMRADLTTNIRSLPRREKIEEYIRWVVAFLLLTKPTTRQTSARVHLREDFKASFNSLTTQANRRQFAWYLRHYPRFERRPMTREEKGKHVGCAACGRRKQKCEYVMSLWGPFYNLETLQKDSDYSSSDLSTDADNDWKEKSEDGKRVHFYLGDSCAKFASVKHKLFHWERRVINEVNKLPVFKILERKHERNKTGYNPEDDIEAVVAYYYPTLSSRAAKLQDDARTLLTRPERYTRYSEKWDDKP